MASTPPMIHVVAPSNLGPDFVANETDKVYEVNVDGSTIARNADGKLAAVAITVSEDGATLGITQPGETTPVLVNIPTSSLDLALIRDAFGETIGHAYV